MISTVPRYILEITLVLFIVLLVIIKVVLENNLNSIIPILGLFGASALRLMPSANLISSLLVKLSYSRDAIKRLYNDIKKQIKIY